MIKAAIIIWIIGFLVFLYCFEYDASMGLGKLTRFSTGSLIFVALAWPFAIAYYCLRRIIENGN